MSPVSGSVNSAMAIGLQASGARPSATMSRATDSGRAALAIVLQGSGRRREDPARAARLTISH